MPSATCSLRFSGQLHNLGDLRDRLQLPAGSEQDILLAGWRRWGTALAEHLVGVYALILRDDGEGLTYLARDALGVKPLYYREDATGLHADFTVPALRQRDPRPVTRDMDWLAAYLLQLSWSQTATGYREIAKLAPGHWLLRRDAGQVTIQRHHHWRDDSPWADRRDPRWVADYRALLEESVRCRMPAEGILGVENSGGLDSAAITALMARFLGRPGDRLHTFGYAFLEDEPGYILETSRACGIKFNHILTGAGDDSGDASLRRSLSALGYPEEHANATSHAPFYEECRLHGIDTLQSGFGGDEVVTSYAQLTQRELLDRHRYGPLWQMHRGNPLLRLLRLLKLATLGRRSPAINRDFEVAWQARWPHQLLRPEVVQRLDLYERYMETAIYDAPYRRTNDFILGYQLSRLRMTARLENCTVVAASHGIDYRWPLLDARLIQQYLSTPSIEKIGPDGLGRYLHRRAIDDLVPRKVAWKRTKSMGQAVRPQAQTPAAGMRRLAESLAMLEAGLDPALEALIDREKFRQLIARAAQGDTDSGFATALGLGTHALRWADAWLKMPD